MTSNAVPDLEWEATTIADFLVIVDYISDDNLDAARVLKSEIEDARKVGRVRGLSH